MSKLCPLTTAGVTRPGALFALPILGRPMLCWWAGPVAAPWLCTNFHESVVPNQGARVGVVRQVPWMSTKFVPNSRPYPRLPLAH